MDRKFIITALIYAVLGLVLGIVMVASHNHSQLVTHAHIMLAGFVVSFFYGLCHKLWLNNNESNLAKIQFYVHQVGLALMSFGFFLSYGKYLKMEIIDPVITLSSIVFTIGMLIMVFLFIKSGKTTNQ
jgi:peptidoglycan/LPS O-acetylase OafA/YrhL